MVIFEIPTGVVADTVGRRMSFLLGTVTLAVTTLLYVLLWQVEAPFWEWALVSMALGLGFTFFSGAVEAWLVDGLEATGYDGDLESVLGKGQVVGGIAMLTGSVAGGYVAQVTNLGIPFVLRGVILVFMFGLAFKLMHDVGFTPQPREGILPEMRRITSASIDHGLRRPSVRWLMLESPFSAGVGIYVFYALQPYLLELVGDPKAYGIAGLVAAIVAGAQIIGGIVAPRMRRLFHRRTSALLLSAAVGVLTLAGMGLFDSFWVVLGLVVVWALLFAATVPIRQAYLNGMIPGQQRATILSFDSMLGSAGGVAFQPGLGKAADVYGYPSTYVASAAISAISIPFLYLSRRENHPCDGQVGQAEAEAALDVPGPPPDPITAQQRPDDASR
jgi:MFS family permease